MFTLSAAFWIDGIVHIALLIADVVDGKSNLDPIIADAGQITLFNALILINVRPLCIPFMVCSRALNTSIVYHHGRHRRMARVGDLSREAYCAAHRYRAVGPDGP
jgi:hypothetical protein